MDHSIKESDRPPYGIIIVLMIGAFISFLNNTLLNIALPSIMKELQIGPSTVQWLTTGFMLVNGILIPATAFLIQKYSVRHLFLAAMVLFTLGTVLAGTAHTLPYFISGTVVTSFWISHHDATLNECDVSEFPSRKRGAAMGVFGLILMFAPAIGPTLSGWIIEHYDWRMLFHFITPIAVIVLLIGFFLLKDKKGKVDIRLDVLSLLLSSIGFGGILYGFSSAGGKGWNSPYVYVTIVVGAISLIFFILRQLKQEKPLLNLDVYRYPMFTLSSIISMILNMALFSGMLLLPIYVQNIRGITPMDAGLLLMPGALLMAFMSPLTGKLFDRYGGRVLAVIGLTIMAVTTYFLSRLELDTTYAHLMIIYAVRCVGIAMVMMPVSTNGLNQLPRHLYPHGTAMNNTLNQVAGAIGTALLVTIMTNRTESQAKELGAIAMQNMTEQPTQEALAQMQQNILTQATLEGINYSFLIAAGISVVALVLAFFIKRAKPMEETQSKEKNVNKVLAE